jgi:hypothetical protein
MVSRGEANIDNVPWETNDIEEHIAREFIRRAARRRNIQTLDYKGQKSLKNEINISLGPEDYPNVFKSWDPKMYYDMIQYLKDSGYTIYPKGYIPPLNINGYRIGGRIKRRFR